MYLPLPTEPQTKEEGAAACLVNCLKFGKILDICKGSSQNMNPGNTKNLP